MQTLELLAPARNADIGIAAIDCGADAVYIAGPAFGARKAAGNSMEEVERLCSHAHKYGARVFVTFNTVIEDDEKELAHSQMLQAQEAGADAFIIRDLSVFDWKDVTVPLHASTQCAIADPERAAAFERAGCSRIILERELPLSEIKRICSAVGCEVECFVHGALCVCYSGKCRLSEAIDGRSADKGECIQACRSLYDLCDASGKVLVRNKALLSLKDLNLLDRLGDLAEAGVCSFKIEGRLKNASYVKNVVRQYDLALNSLVAAHPDRYRRASFGKIDANWMPDSSKTFNRGYTSLYFDGKRDRWSSMNAPKSMGEKIGKVLSIKPLASGCEIRAELLDGCRLSNGDGFSFATSDGVCGFRGDVCEGQRIVTRSCVPDLRKGMVLFRNLSSNFEKMLESQPCRRIIDVDVKLRISGKYSIELDVSSQDGRHFLSSFNTDTDTAENGERALAMLREQLSKRSGIYSFKVSEIDVQTAGGRLPLLSASTINGMRRLTAEDLDALPCGRIAIQGRGVSEEVLTCAVSGASGVDAAGADSEADREEVVERPCTAAEPLVGGGKDELMRSRYCIRYELGMCPKKQGAKESGALFLVNNGRRLSLRFDCSKCEMSVFEA